MRKSFPFFVFLFLFLATSIYSQNLEFECQIIDSSTYWQLTPDIVFFEPSTIFLTWTDYFFPSDYRIFCAKSENGGVSFLPKVEPEPLSATKMLSSVDVDGIGNPFLAWCDYKTGYLNVWFSKSNDGGGSFFPGVVVDSIDFSEFTPEIKVSYNGVRVFVAWITVFGDSLGTDSAKLFLSKSINGGGSFLPPQHIGGSQNQQYDFSFDINSGGDTVVFVWQDNSLASPRLFFTSSTDYGVTFSPPSIVDPNSASHFQPSLSLYGDSVYIAYTDNRNISWDILMAITQVSNTPSFTYRIVDYESHKQEQSSIDIDNQGNIYVSYRNEESGVKAMTYISVLEKGGPVVYKDWVGIFGFDNTEPRIAVKDTMNVFFTWEYHIFDTMSITIFARSVPAEPPGPPQDLRANGANPSPWDTLPIFEITFIKPFDLSGIYLIFYKLGSPPVSNFDTTGSFKDTSSSDTSAFTVIDSVEGGDPLFVWLMDGRGNLDYHNNSSVLLRYDRTPPTPPIRILPDSGSVVNDRRPFFLWHTSTDSGGSGLLTYFLILDTTSDFSDSSAFYTTGLDTFLDLPDPLWDDFYYWSVIPFDSAGNLQYNVGYWDFLVRATPPPVPIEPPDSGWVGRNFLLRWHRILDPLAFVDKYFGEIASDSGFNNVIFMDSTFGPQDTTKPINNWTQGDGYWHVRSRNRYGIYTKWSQRMFFRYDSIPPPAPVLISPPDSFLTNNPRPTFDWHPVSDSQSGLRLYVVGVFSDSTLYDTVFWALTQDTFTTPTSDLPDGSLYWFALARDSAGNLSDASDTFLLIIDTQPPEVNTVIPSDGQAGVSVSSNIIVVFSEPMDSSTFDDSTFIVIDNMSYRYFGTFQFNPTLDQLTFDPNENFYGGRNILVTIKKDVTDIANNMMTSDYTWQFVTESVNDSVGPVVYNLFLDPDTVYLGQDVVITATVSDSGRGNSKISGCELFIDSIGQDSTGEMFLPLDSFDYITEDVIDTLRTDSIPYKTSHWVYIHGLDVEGNWGGFDSLQFWLIDTMPPELEAVVSPDTCYLGEDFNVGVTSNKTLKGIDSCYIVDSDNNRLEIEMERDSLDTDSTSFSKTFVLSGLEPGNATLYVEGRDLYDKTGGDSVDFIVEAEDKFLPEKRVYTWPNPAEDEVHFRFYVSRNAEIIIEIFTITGKKLTTLIKTIANGGDPNSEIVWSTRNVGSDIYIFRLQANSINSSDKDTVIKRFAIVK